MILTARRENRLRELAGELASAPQHQNVVIVPGDVTDPSLRTRLIERAASDLGGLDLLINNAGVGAVGPFADADEARLRRIMEVNFFAPVLFIREALPLLRRGNRPLIANIGSVLGHRAVAGKSEYCASKFALHGFSDALRCELAAEGIDVLLVSPSTTQSEFFENVLEGQTAARPSRGAGMPAGTVARKTVRAIARGRHEIILSGGGKLLVWADRLCPPLMNRLLARFR